MIRIEMQNELLYIYNYIYIYLFIYLWTEVLWFIYLVHWTLAWNKCVHYYYY